MKLLVVSSLYPNRSNPQHGVFIENKIRQRADEKFVTEQKVVAPYPIVPRWISLIPRYRSLRMAHRRDHRFGVDVRYPRYLALPKIGMLVSPILMYWGMRRLVGRLIAEGFGVDLIDSHYFYPDGVAAVLLGRKFSRPVVITSLGTDLNVLANHAIPRWWIRYAAARARGLITVSQALKDKMIALGIPSQRIGVIPNGVDLDAFKPVSRETVRHRYGLEGTVLLAVGNLVSFKGQDVAIRSLKLLPNATLIIVGQGQDYIRLLRLSEICGVADRVRFVGSIEQVTLTHFYSASDVFLHMSEREGMPNVVLEALACGTPVVATAVGGIPEVISSSEYGRLLTDRAPEALAEAIKDVLDNPLDRDALRRRANDFRWAVTTQLQMDCFSNILRWPAAPEAVIQDTAAIRSLHPCI